MISAKEIAKKEHERSMVRKNTYRTILEQMCRKIRSACERNIRFAIVSVPPMVIGYPPYNIPHAVKYIERQLKRLGYTVMQVGVVDFQVTWKTCPEIDEIIDHGDDILPSLANLQKTAKRIRNSTS
jgi:hypothetical protein